MSKREILTEVTTTVGIAFRAAQHADIAALAALRAAEWETEACWKRRMGEYLPEQGAKDRTILIAEDGGTPVGFVAGHRTRRFGCDGELQWINVDSVSRGAGGLGRCWYGRSEPGFSNKEHGGFASMLSLKMRLPVDSTPAVEQNH